MRYARWNINKLLEHKRKLVNMFYNKPTDSIALAINAINDLINDNPNIFPVNTKFEEQVKIDKLILDRYSSFLPDINAYYTINKGVKNIFVPEPMELNIRKSDILSFLHDFYHSFDSEIAKLFDRIYKDRKDNLRLVRDKNMRNYITYIKELNYAYINVSLTDTVDDFINIIHEYGHAIADQYKYRHKYESYPFVELLPFVSSLVAYDVLDASYEGLEESISLSKMGYVKTLYKYAKDIILLNGYINNHDGSLERQSFITSFAESTHSTKSKIDKLLQVSLLEKISYIIPFIIAVELYYEYYMDNDVMMDKLKTILTTDANDYHDLIDDLDIKPNSHMEEFVEDSSKRIKTYKYM